MASDIVLYDYCAIVLLLIVVFYYFRTSVHGTYRARIMTLIVSVIIAASVCDATRVRYQIRACQFRLSVADLHDTAHVSALHPCNYGYMAQVWIVGIKECDVRAPYGHQCRSSCCKLFQAGSV